MKISRATLLNMEQLKRSFLCIYSRGGHAAGAKEIFETMTEVGVRADHVSYNILIDAFGRAGLTAGMNLTH